MHVDGEVAEKGLEKISGREIIKLRKVKSTVCGIKNDGSCWLQWFRTMNFPVGV